MARNTYLTESHLTGQLPTGHGFNTAALTDIRERASEWVDSRLSRIYWTPFWDISDTPSTPQAVHELALLYASWYARTRLAASHRADDAGELQSLRNIAEAALAPYIGDKPTAKIGPVAVGPETIALVGGDYPDWHLFEAVQLDVNPASVVVYTADASTYFENYTDFGVGYSSIHRSWYLYRNNASIVDGCKVTYDVSLIRRREEDLPRSASGRILLG